MSTQGALEQHVAVRLDAATIARLEALIPTLSTEWRTARRSDVLRKVILSGLAVIEGQRKTAERRVKPGRPRRAPKSKHRPQSKMP